MEERFVEIATPSGRMETFVTHPEQDGPFPAVIVYMDIWGVREELFEIARRVGTVGLLLHGAGFLLPAGQGATRVPRRAETHDIPARARRPEKAAGHRAREAAPHPDVR